MIYLRKNSKILIVISIFLISVAVGINQSKLLESFHHTNKSEIGEEILEKFRELKNFKKAKVIIHAEDFKNNIEELDKLLNENNAKVLLSERKTKVYVALLEVSNKDTDTFLEGIRALSILKSEKISTKEPEVLINVEERLENYMLQKNQIKKLISETTLPDRLEQLYRQLTSVQVSLDSLKTLKVGGLKHSINDLILLEIIGGNEEENTTSYILGNFFKITLVAIILLTLIFVIFYLLMASMMWLMMKIGIKTSRSGTGYYGKNNYNSHKVKRVYKDKSDKEEKSNKENK